VTAFESGIDPVASADAPWPEVSPRADLRRIAARRGVVYGAELFPEPVPPELAVLDALALLGTGDARNLPRARELLRGVQLEGVPRHVATLLDANEKFVETFRSVSESVFDEAAIPVTSGEFARALVVVAKEPPPFFDALLDPLARCARRAALTDDLSRVRPIPEKTRFERYKRLLNTLFDEASLAKEAGGKKPLAELVGRLPPRLAGPLEIDEVLLLNNVGRYAEEPGWVTKERWGHALVDVDPVLAAAVLVRAAEDRIVQHSCDWETGLAVIADVARVVAKARAAGSLPVEDERWCGFVSLRLALERAYLADVTDAAPEVGIDACRSAIRLLAAAERPDEVVDEAKWKSAAEPLVGFLLATGREREVDAAMLVRLEKHPLAAEVQRRCGQPEAALELLERSDYERNDAWGGAVLEARALAHAQRGDAAAANAALEAAARLPADWRHGHRGIGSLEDVRARVAALLASAPGGGR
jgi:hypothetical protein